MALAGVELQPQIFQLGARRLQRALTVEPAADRDREIIPLCRPPDYAERGVTVLVSGG